MLSRRTPITSTACIMCMRTTDGDGQRKTIRNHHPRRQPAGAQFIHLPSDKRNETTERRYQPTRKTQEKTKRKDKEWTSSPSPCQPIKIDKAEAERFSVSRRLNSTTKSHARKTQEETKQRDEEWTSSPSACRPIKLDEAEVERLSVSRRLNSAMKRRAC